MKCKKEWLQLYAITDRSRPGENTLAEQVERALRGGATIIQLREKHADDASFLAQACALVPICRKYNAPLIINDRVDIALKSGADGVHIGQGDMEIAQARRLMGDEKLIGASAHSATEARAAQAAGADYLGAGSVFHTSTKLDAGHLSRDTLHEICQAVCIPIVAIGGITEANLLELKGSGIDGVAVVSAIFAQPDVEAAAKRLRALTERL